MKKDKEWLKNEILGLSIKARHKENNQREWHMGHEMALFDVNKLIDQLDEPETLSQEWIDENMVEGDFRGEQEFWYGRFIEEEKVRNLLVPKQDNGFVVFEKDKLDEEIQRMIAETYKAMSEKPVIPQFVADWYEENLLGGHTDNRNKFSGNDVFRVIEDVLETSEGFKVFENYGIDKKIATWAEENEEDFIHLIVNCSYKEGYEVEKEPQWVVKDNTGYLSYLQFSIPNIYEHETSLDKNDAYKFNSKSKADLIADLVDGTVEEVTE